MSIVFSMLLPMLIAQAKGADGEDFAIFESPGFRAVIGNNAARGAHRERYNGIYEIAATGEDASPFVPSYAGWNLEHYFDARPMPEDSATFFEPREAPMTFRRIDDISCELHQPETPYWGVESWTRFAVRVPHTVDFEFACVPHKDLRGFLGMFWASYINAPENKAMYFLREGSSLDAPQWIQLAAHEHNRDSTVLPANDAGNIAFDAGGRPTLYNSLSPLRYAEPFFYGRWRDMVLIYIFDKDANIRLAHSPSGGGKTEDGTDTNPAWDFQWIIPGAKVGERYDVGGRFVFKAWAGREDVIAEVRRYRRGK